jgi:hypothetical protein
MFGIFLNCFFLADPATILGGTTQAELLILRAAAQNPRSVTTPLSSTERAFLAMYVHVWVTVDSLLLFGCALSACVFVGSFVPLYLLLKVLDIVVSLYDWFRT